MTLVSAAPVARLARRLGCAVRRPLVLVPARWARVIEGRERPGLFAPRSLMDAISRAGGEPVLAWPDGLERARDLVALADAVVLQGGDDLDLRPFGVPDVHPRRRTHPPSRTPPTWRWRGPRPGPGRRVPDPRHLPRHAGPQHRARRHDPPALRGDDGRPRQQPARRRRRPRHAARARHWRRRRWRAGPTTTRPATASRTGMAAVGHDRRTGASRRWSRPTGGSSPCSGTPRSTRRRCRTSRRCSTGWSLEPEPAPAPEAQSG